jgi:hypothetical protein
MVWVLLAPGFRELKLIALMFDGDKDGKKEVSLYSTRRQRETDASRTFCTYRQAVLYAGPMCRPRSP